MHPSCSRGTAALRTVISRTLGWVAIVLVSLVVPGLSVAQESADDSSATRTTSRFGGPDAVENQIADDARPVTALIKERVLQPWFDWKAALAENTGIAFGLDYSGLYLGADNSVGENTAAGGILRFFGSWDLVGRGTPNTGVLVWKVEHRHGYSDVVPSAFGLGELGYVGIIEAPFSDQGTRLTNLYWRQRFIEGKVALIGGYLDTTDYVDTFAGGSPWTGFGNLVFSTGSASLFLPNDATLGIAGAGMITDNLYAIGGITNAYADPTSPFENSVERFFSDGEHFKTLEIGWTTSQERIYLDNTHVTFWHVDDSLKAGAVEGWGIAFSHVRYLGGKWLPFLRGGYTEDGGSLLQKSLSGGLLYQSEPGRDLFGLGLNWGNLTKRPLRRTSMTSTHWRSSIAFSWPSRRRSHPASST